MSDDLVKRLKGWLIDIQTRSTGVWAMDQDLKAGIYRIEELEKQNASLEAKLAKAVEALEFLEIAATGAGVPHPKERELLQNCIRKARAALADIEGEQP